MKRRNFLVLLLLLATFSACNQTDDVMAIFTGKTWRLTGIFYDKGRNPDLCTDYWNSDAEKEASDELFSIESNYRVIFNGVEFEDIVTGTYTGRASRSEISGNWEADGDNNSFKVTNQSAPNSSEDILGKAFINGFINAYKYDGDTNGNLRIYFVDLNKDDKRFMLFHIVN